MSHLSVVVDLSPVNWHLSAHRDNQYPLSLSFFLSQLLVFLNAHIAATHENSLAVFAALPGKSELVFSSLDSPLDALLTDANSYPPFRSVDSTVVTRIMSELEALGQAEKEGSPELPPCALVGAITKALCHVNRVLSTIATDKSAATAESPDPRILILSVSPDLTSSYIPIMNAIFSAQKLKVTIDACQLYGSDAVFLQQAAHLTGGSFILLERRDALLQYLIMSFLPPPSVRKILAVPTQEKIDFRAVCFCHKNIVDIGFVCSVCLSIFCQPVPVCSTCRTKFPIKTLQRLNQSRPVQVARTPSASTASSPRPSISASTGLPHSSTINVNVHSQNENNKVNGTQS